MDFRHAIIGYCHTPDGSPPLIDVFEVKDPAPWVLSDKLVDVPMGRQGYQLPELDDIKTDHPQPVPTQVAEDLPITEFGELINYVATEEVYLVHPDGLYSMLAAPHALNICEMYMQAMEVYVYEDDTSLANRIPDFTLDNEQLAAVVDDDYLRTVLAETHLPLITYGAYLDRNDISANEASAMEINVQGTDATAVAEFTNPSLFSDLLPGGFLLINGCPENEHENLQQRARGFMEHIDSIRALCGGIYHRYLHRGIDAAPSPEDTRYQDQPEGKRRSLITQDHYIKQLLKAIGVIISPLSASPFGPRVVEEYDAASATAVRPVIPE